MKNFLLLTLFCCGLLGCEKKDTLKEEYAWLIAETAMDEDVLAQQNISRETEVLIFRSTTFNDADISVISTELARKDPKAAAQKLQDAGFFEPERLTFLLAERLRLDVITFQKRLVATNYLPEAKQLAVLEMMEEEIEYNPGVPNEVFKEVVIKKFLEDQNSKK